MNEEDQDNDEPDQENEPRYDENGNLFIKLGLDDSALVVRADGTIEMVSHDLESAEDGYMGDVEDLSKTFSLVLALVSALENEELYNRIFHNLNMILMKKWEVLDDGTKEMIIEKRKKISDDLSPEEGEEKLQRVNEFRKRMNKYKDKKVKKVKRNPLAKLIGANWNPYDKSLKAHWKPWHVDEPPKLEDDE